jgi:hypothetical protein
MRYKSFIPNPALVAPIMLTVEPGQEFDSPIGLNHPELVPLDDEAKVFAAEIAAENEAHAAAFRARIGAPPPEGTPAEITPEAVRSFPDYRAALGLDPLPPTPESGGAVGGPVETAVGEAGPETAVKQPEAKE